MGERGQKCPKKVHLVYDPNHSISRCYCKVLWHGPYQKLKFNFQCIIFQNFMSRLQHWTFHLIPFTYLKHPWSRFSSIVGKKRIKCETTIAIVGWYVRFLLMPKQNNAEISWFPTWKNSSHNFNTNKKVKNN